MRIAVIAWSMGHNAMIRAWYLADILRARHDVELAGPLLAQFGTDIWPPVRGTGDVRLRAFDGHDLSCYVDEARRFAATIEADVVYVSKPRFPGALLGEMVASRCGAPLVLDIDDDEEALAGTDLMRCDTPELIAEADAVTVVSEPLQNRYGGTLVGQARDERLFDPSRYDRAGARAELGYGSGDVVILFLGTPRRHKGVLQAARAVREIGDPRLRLCIVGSVSEKRLREELSEFDPRVVQLVDYRPITEVPRLLTIGDLVCLAQDPMATVARYQIPMKLTEAMAMRLPVIATQTPALAPFIEQDLIAATGDAPLAQLIGEFCADPRAMHERASRAREYYLEHLTYRTVGEVLENVLSSLNGPAPRPRWPDSVSRAKERARCQRGGPPGHAEDDREATRELIRSLAADARTSVEAVLDRSSRCALLGYPNHSNPGDHAIWLGAKRLLSELDIETVYECDWKTYSREALSRAVDLQATILLTGGGNFGDLWPNTQGLRERVLADFAGAPTVQLPQSIEFESEENRERARVLLEQHGNVTLMVRDRDSLARARQWFDVPTWLVPDLAFAATPPDPGDSPVVDLLWVARTDKESRGFRPPADDHAESIEVGDWTAPAEHNKRFVAAAVSAAALDMRTLSDSWEQISRERLAMGCDFLRRGRVIVTDRLHVHVMALHLGAPAVVTDNSYGKVRGLYDTYTAPAPIARWASSGAEALEIARGWLTTEPGSLAPAGGRHRDRP